MSGVDARDFIKGIRPWSQFLTYTTYLAQNVDGSALWAAQLDDERFLPEIEKLIKKMKKDGVVARPALTGYSREVDGLHRVATELRMLRAEISKTEAPPILGPLFPSEKIAARETEIEISELAAAVAVGHRNWEEAKERARI